MQSASLERLKAMLENDDPSGFEMHLRLEGEWDQIRFERLMTCLEEALGELGGQALVPRWLAAWFCWAPDWIARNASGDAFYRRRPVTFHYDDYVALVAAGLRRLNDAVHVFAYDRPTAQPHGEAQATGSGTQ
jgi:hypothetical protein